MEIIVADDGSEDNTAAVIKSWSSACPYPVTVLELPHGERGIARVKAVEAAKHRDIGYLIVIDSDMVLDDGLVQGCMDYLDTHPEVGALVIPEEAYTLEQNFFSKVKVFERNVINNAGEELGKRSIEAARCWRMEAFLHTGGFRAEQISFEEIQPTLRYIGQGGIVRRAVFTKLYHNEKKVLLRELLRKKAYYFSVMDRTMSTEAGGFRKALERWYWFRPVLYRGSNIKRYFRHPLLAAAMFYMYGCLSILGGAAFIGGLLKKWTARRERGRA